MVRETKISRDIGPGSRFTLGRPIRLACALEVYGYLFSARTRSYIFYTTRVFAQTLHHERTDTFAQRPGFNCVV